MTRLIGKFILIMLSVIVLAPAGMAHAVVEPPPAIDLSIAEKGWIRDHPLIRLGVDPEFAPFEYIDEEGIYRGIAADYIAILNKRLGLNMQVVGGLTWSEAVAKAERGDIDVLPCVSRTEDRNDFVTYSDCYVNFHRVIIARADSPAIAGLDDIRDLRVAVQGKTSHDGFLADDTDITPLRYATLREALLAVAAGKSDVFVGNVASATYWITQENLTNLRVAAVVTMESDDLHFAVRKNWPELVTIINKGLASITMAEKVEIQRRWVAVEYTAGINQRTAFNYFSMLLGVGLCLFFGFMLYNRALKKQVKQKTMALREELSERQEAERALGVSEQRFKAIFNATNDAIFVHDIDTFAILDVNDKMCEMFGLSYEEALNVDIGTISSGVSPYTQADAVGWMQKAAAGVAQLFEWCGKDSSGNLLWLEVNMRRAAIGDVERIIVTSRDISERKKADAELAKVFQQRKELELIVNKSQAVAFLWRAADGWPVEYVSQNVEQWGYQAEDFTAGVIDYDDLIHRDDLARVVAEVADCSATGINDLKQEYRLITKPGDVLWVEDVTCIRRDDNGNISHYQGLVLDVTEKQKAQDELLHHKQNLELLVEKRTAELEHSRLALINLVEDLNVANGKLKEVDRLKSMFIASMSHELRTPLNSVIGFSSILLNEWTGPLNDEQKQNVASVLRSGKHLLSLINDVIDISKVEAGMISADNSEFDLADLLEEVEQTFIKQAQDAGLALKVEKLSVTMHTDRRRLLQCVLNLVSNGIKYTEAGQVTVKVTLQQDENQEMVAIAVTDSGIGIALDDQPKLFRAFSRIQSDLSSKVLGTGLGLYLTKKIGTEILHGKISMVSEAGQGSTFMLSVPTELASAVKLEQQKIAHTLN
jgi:PAS domain S-box-containing protein